MKEGIRLFQVERFLKQRICGELSQLHLYECDQILLRFHSYVAMETTAYALSQYINDNKTLCANILKSSENKLISIPLSLVEQLAASFGIKHLNSTNRREPWLLDLNEDYKTTITLIIEEPEIEYFYPEYKEHFQIFKFTNQGTRNLSQERGI